MTQNSKDLGEAQSKIKRLAALVRDCMTWMHDDESKIDLADLEERASQELQKKEGQNLHLIGDVRDLMDPERPVTMNGNGPHPEIIEEIALAISSLLERGEEMPDGWVIAHYLWCQYDALQHCYDILSDQKEGR